jgi:hypothetical protein
MFKRIFDFFKRLFSKLFKEKKPRQMKIVVPKTDISGATMFKKIFQKHYIHPRSG